jgi:ketose-bisphosphate aldolase
MLVNLNEVLSKARKSGYAVPAFDCVEDLMIRTILDTAEEEKSPVILMVLEYDLKGRGIKYITGLVHAVAGEYNIPIVLHLDHADNTEIIRKAIDHGFTSVMFDGSFLPFEENIRISKEVSELAHKYNITVEAELGLVAGKDIHGDDYPGEGENKLTEPAQVIEFIEKANIDALAVSIGTSHGLYKSIPNLDIERLKNINKVSKIPLVLHGGSGTPVDQLQKAIKNGITKLNVYSDSRNAMLKGLKKSAQLHKREDPLPDVLFQPIKDELSLMVSERMKMFYSQNRV